MDFEGHSQCLIRQNLLRLDKSASCMHTLRLNVRNFKCILSLFWFHMTYLLVLITQKSHWQQIFFCDLDLGCRPFATFSLGSFLTFKVREAAWFSEHWNIASNPTQFSRSKADSIPILGSLEGRESVPPSHFRFRVWEADCLLNQPPKPLT